MSEINNFCLTLKKMISFFKQNLNNNNNNVYRIQRQINIAIDETPAYVIDSVGEYLWKYKESIYSCNEYFYNNYKPDEDIPKEFLNDKEIILDIINLCFNSWKNLIKYKKKIIMNYIKDLLVIYIKYKHKNNS